MAVRTIVPLLTGGAVVTAALAFAYTRRPVRAPLSSGDDARFAPEQVGPDEGMVEVLSLASGPNLAARSEAEAIAGVGAAWPLLEDSESSGDEVLVSVSDVDVNTSSSDGEGDRPTLTGTQYASLGYGFTAVDPGEAFLDLDVEFEELETPTDRDPSSFASDLPRERLEPYDSIAPEDLGTEWLARATEAPNDDAIAPAEIEVERLRLERMDTLEDIDDAPTDPATISAARRRLAEKGLAQNDEKPLDSGNSESSRRS